MTDQAGQAGQLHRQEPGAGGGPRTHADRPTVLIVEDDVGVAELYTEWVDDTYTVQVAHDGAHAIELLDDHIDIVLLDRRMPNRSGEEVLQVIRERGIDCRVAMVSAVAPDFDVVEMDIDQYLTKPVSKATLQDTIDDLLARADYHGQVQRYYSLAARCAALEAEKTEAELAASDKYATVQAELADVRDQLTDDVRDATTHHDATVGCCDSGGETDPRDGGGA